MQSIMQMQTVWSALILTIALAVPRVCPGQSKDPWFGTWKLNVAQSHYDPGPPPRDTTTKIEPSDGGVKFTVDTVSAAGQARHIEWSGKYGRKDNPVMGDPYADTISIRRVNGHTYETVTKKNGKVATTTMNVISADGKTRTATAIDKNAQITQGPSRNVAVFGKQ